MEDVIKATQRHLKGKKRVAFYEDLITAFEDMDCDNLHECRGIDKDFDAALDSIYGNEDQENEE